MATPLIIDTDMGIDDAVAVGLALSSAALEVRAVIGVGGRVEVDQVATNISRVLTAFSPVRMPAIARGSEPSASVQKGGFLPTGRDGLGDCTLPEGQAEIEQDFLAVYRRCLEQAGDPVTILSLGPLTNLAALVNEAPDLKSRIARVAISGGTVWVKGDIAATEFNFHRDPAAAAQVLSSGLPITVAPLDVTSFLALDESHVAHLAASGTRIGQTLATLLRSALAADHPPGVGKTHIHDAVAAAALLWPDLFMRTRMRLDVLTTGSEAGRCKPQLGGDPSQRVDLLTAVNAVDLLENLLESLCHEAFVV